MKLNLQKPRRSREKTRKKFHFSKTIFKIFLKLGWGLRLPEPPAWTPSAPTPCIHPYKLYGYDTIYSPLAPNLSTRAQSIVPTSHSPATMNYMRVNTMSSPNPQWGAPAGGEGGDSTSIETENIVEKWCYYSELYKMRKVLEDCIKMGKNQFSIDISCLNKTILS